MKLLLNYLAITILLLGCSSNDKSITIAPLTTPTIPVTAVINTAVVAQLIDGFGGSTAWSGQLSDPEMASLFGSQDNQLGLSIIRLRIDPNDNWADEKSNAEKAVALGAKVLATPWTPPIAMKTNNNIIGGRLTPSMYVDYAKWLKSFCDYLGNVNVISIQNEPNIDVPYESCTWNSLEMLDFVKNNAAAIGTPLLIPETFNSDFSFSDPILSDPLALANVTYVGGHIYGTAIKKYDNALNKGKRTWMTEHYFDTNDIATNLKTAKEIHDCMTIANNSAYIWWTLKAFDCYLIKNGTLNTKAYMIGQFSKFIRPNYYRIEATNNPNPNIYISAYKDVTKVVIVAINMGSSKMNQVFNIQNTTLNTAIPYTTTSIKNIEKGPMINITSSGFTALLPEQSVTTFVCELF
jgi:glucuronoarabinoxylan endo-1,4-beta-xylanase